MTKLNPLTYPGQGKDESPPPISPCPENHSKFNPLAEKRKVVYYGIKGRLYEETRWRN